MRKFPLDRRKVQRIQKEKYSDPIGSASRFLCAKRHQRALPGLTLIRRGLPAWRLPHTTGPAFTATQRRGLLLYAGAVGNVKIFTFSSCSKIIREFARQIWYNEYNL